MPAAGEPATTHPLAIAALVCGVLGLLLLPIIFGPAALIAGAIAENQTRSQKRPGKWLAGAGALLGLIEVGMLVG